MESPTAKSVLQAIESNTIVGESSVFAIFHELTAILCNEPNVLSLVGPTIICGDVHGQLDDVLELFATALDLNVSAIALPGEYEAILASDKQFLFLGDYVDRGHYSLNTFLYLACLKILKPEKFYLLRGNHECQEVSFQYGLYSECLLNYGHSHVWTGCLGVFNYLPIAAVVDGLLFAVHGGLSPEVPYVYLISDSDRRKDVKREGAISDLLWSDPAEVESWRFNVGRGAGVYFGKKHLQEFLRVNKLKNMVRAHQEVQAGYSASFPSEDKTKRLQYVLYTVWSAPNYAYRLGNKATVLKFDFSEKDMFDFKEFGPRKQRFEVQDPPVARRYFA
jgi:diadenosine tetraphosphatase ApaH/serine/threonine PP2A family protein phosphatase